MNTVKQIALLLLIGIFTYSCNDWLDVTSSSQVRSEEQFASEEGFKDALIGAYIGLADESLYSRQLTWNMVDLLSQQYATLPSQAVLDELQQFNYETSNSAPVVEGVWTGAYNVIANINNALEYIEKDEGVLGSPDRDLIKGELLGLRAFLHFDLMRLYGHGNLGERSGLSGELTIPYVQDHSKEIPAQESYETTFALLEEDLGEALSLLQADPVVEDPERPEDFYDGADDDGFYDDREQRMNYYAVKALQARVLLWKGDTGAAGEAAEEVLQSSDASLIDGDNYSVSNDPVLYPEVLFGIYVSGLEDLVNEYLDASDQTNYNAVFMTSGDVEEVYETDNSNVGPPDVRYNSLLQSQNQGYVSQKLYQRSGLVNPNIVPLIKLPEMYYIAAEYHLENGGQDRAIEYLNEVRQSRGIIEQIPEDATGEEVEEELFKEYRKEFVSEGQLFYYYKRRGVEQIPGVSREMDDETYMLPYPDGEIEFRTSN